jgi:O-glycosyl hydrolase
MINYHKNPHVHTVVVDEKHQLATQFGGVAVPAVHIFKRDNPHSPSFSSNEAFDFEKIMIEVDKFVEHLQVEDQNQVKFLFSCSYCSFIFRPLNRLLMLRQSHKSRLIGINLKYNIST